MKYLDRLSRAAYWQLSREEAADIMNDYQEMFEEKLSMGESLPDESGDPYQVIKCLRNNKQYFTWMFAFCAMLMCLFSMTACLFLREYALWIVVCMYIFSEVLSVLYFRATDRERVYGPRPGGLSWLLAAELIIALVILSVVAVLFAGFNPKMLLPFWDILGPENIGVTITRVIETAALILAGLSVLGLYKAKINDRRWRALYSFGITVIALFALIISAMHSVDLSGGQINWFSCAALFGAGCIAAGVSLY